MELAALRKDGVEIAIDLALSRIDAAGDPSFFGIIRDISERKRTEAALVERARVASVSAEIGLTLTRSDSLRDLLSACCEILVQHLGVAFARVWLFDGESQVLELQASAGMYTHLDGTHSRVPIGQLKIGRIAAQRERHVSNDVASDPWIGSPAWAREQKLVAFAGYPLSVDGELIGVLAMFSCSPLGDITVDMLEAVCDAIAVRARGKLIEQAKSALEEQLRQSQKMEAVGRLAGGIAHDFNNVLSVVLSYTELMLAQTAAGDPLQGDILEINRAGKRAADLTRQLLMFSRQQVTAPVVLDLGAVLAQMDKMLRRILGEDVELTYEADAALGNVRADPGSIEQVIVNLIVNARDAMPRGGRLRVAVSNVGAHVRLAITDTGTGMDETTLARIYEPFFTTKPVGKGTGLGLATVFGIVKQSGGTIGVQSRPERGDDLRDPAPAGGGGCRDAAAARRRIVEHARHRDHPPRRGRGSGARRRRRDPPTARLPGARRAQRRRRAGPVRRASRPHPPAAHRRRHAAHERSRARPSPQPHPPRHARALHVGIHR